MNLDLDRRQRAILDEMGVHVWWPETPPAAMASAMPAPKSVARAAPEPGPAPAPVAATAVERVSSLDWATLAQTVAACTACGLSAGRRSAVFAAALAPHSAHWMVVGEPPDDNEERLGLPFAGQAGQLLDNMLKAVGVRRGGHDGAAAEAAGAAYVSNCVKCRPALARNPEPQELAACENYLQREVALVRPKVILALGRFAAQTLLQGSLPDVAGTPRGKLRGRIYRYQGIPVIVSYHPAYLLRTPQDKARAWADLCLAMSALAA